MKATDRLAMDRAVKIGLYGVKRIPRKQKKFNKNIQHADPGKRLSYMFERAIMSAYKKQTAFGTLIDEDLKMMRDKIKNLNK